MKKRVFTRGAVGVALLVACMPTEPCACPPARTSVILYGEVRTADGAPAAGATLQYVLARPASGSDAGDICAFDPVINDADPAGASADAVGRFRHADLLAIWPSHTLSARHFIRRGRQRACGGPTGAVSRDAARQRGAGPRAPVSAPSKVMLQLTEPFGCSRRSQLHGDLQLNLGVTRTTTDIGGHYGQRHNIAAVDVARATVSRR